jgi:hypothetical protein
MRLLQALSNRSDLDVATSNRDERLPVGAEARASAAAKLTKSIRKLPRRMKLIAHR